MKVMLLDGDWGTSNLKPADRPAPEPAPGELVIAIKAVSINPRDRIMCQGGYGRMGGSLPLVPLCDGAGEVTALGEGVTSYEPGELVVPAFSRTWLAGTVGPYTHLGGHGGPLDGTAQEFMAVPASAVVRAPAHMSAAQAATLPCAAVTAWNAISEQGNVRAGDVVLLQGTGGVSLFALQFAKMQGAEVIVTSSSNEKLERASAMGADHTINYREDPDWHKTARIITGGRGVDHVVEVGGAGTLEKSIGAVRPSGSISVIGVLSGLSGELNLGRIVTSNIRLQGVTVGSREMLKRMARAMELHGTEPAIDDERFELENLGAALDALPEGRHFGKVVCEL